MKRLMLVFTILLTTLPAWAAPQATPVPTTEVVAAPQEDPSVSAEEARFEAKAKAAQEKAARKAAKKEAKADKLAQDRGIFYTNGRMDFVKLDTMKSKLVKARNPQHPAQISVEQMKLYLSSIIVSENNLLKKAPEIERVYNDSAVDFLAPIIVKAFNNAKPDEAVTVSWLTKDPYFVIRNDRIAISTMWVQNGQLYVQFNKLLAKLVGDTDKKDNINFVVGNAKSLHIKLVSNGSVVVTNKHKHEVAINMAGDFSNVQTPDTATAQTSTSKSTVKQRLMDLDQLRKDKMITEPEYLSKRKKILDNL
ncbi:MAG: hypothetical protein COV45_04475 [Deltaproteobacteria bacterium CG11_big_fil_rev_8_21_14_0_20_47_16]|nr:MAG: hypothetical protein COV45_04475 [Deltaproteobacteria bacterium CG11_big_fil_rev_8_21_14_0_20_47_16]